MKQDELDLDHMEEVARAAPAQGQWHVVHDAQHPANQRITSDRQPHIAKVYGQDLGDAINAKANAAHIATFDPPTVLTLIARVREAEGELREATAYLDERQTPTHDQGEDGGPLSILGRIAHEVEHWFKVATLADVRAKAAEARAAELEKLEKSADDLAWYNAARVAALEATVERIGRISGDRHMRDSRAAIHRISGIIADYRRTTLSPPTDEVND